VTIFECSEVWLKWRATRFNDYLRVVASDYVIWKELIVVTLGVEHPIQCSRESEGLHEVALSLDLVIESFTHFCRSLVLGCICLLLAMRSCFICY